MTFPQQILVAGAVGGAVCGATLAALVAIVQQVGGAVAALEDEPVTQLDVNVGDGPLR